MTDAIGGNLDDLSARHLVVDDQDRYSRTAVEGMGDMRGRVRACVPPLPACMSAYRPA